MNDPIDITERTFNLAVRIVKQCQVLDQSLGTNRTLSNQLLRAGTSIGANVEEAQAAQSRKDFISKMSISSKEARETFYWLRILIASDIMSEQKLTPLKTEANEIISIITTIVKNAAANLANQ